MPVTRQVSRGRCPGAPLQCCFNPSDPVNPGRRGTWESLKKAGHLRQGSNLPYDDVFGRGARVQGKVCLDSTIFGRFARFASVHTDVKGRNRQEQGERAHSIGGLICSTKVPPGYDCCWCHGSRDLRKSQATFQAVRSDVALPITQCVRSPLCNPPATERALGTRVLRIRRSVGGLGDLRICQSSLLARDVGQYILPQTHRISRLLVLLLARPAARGPGDD